MKEDILLTQSLRMVILPFTGYSIWFSKVVPEYYNKAKLADSIHICRPGQLESKLF